MTLRSIAGPFGEVQIVAGRRVVVLDVQGRHRDTFGQLRRDHGLVALPLRDARALHERLGLAICRAAIGPGVPKEPTPAQPIGRSAVLVASVAAYFVGVASTHPAYAVRGAGQLSPAVVAQLATACPAPAVPVQRIVAAVEVESGGNVLAIHDNVTREALYPATKAGAIALAARLIAEGHRPDLGLMQINAANLSRTRLTVETAFDAQANICAGMAITAEAERAVSCIYNTGKPSCANGYPERITRAVQRVGAPTPTQSSPSVIVSTPAPLADGPADAAIETVFSGG